MSAWLSVIGIGEDGLPGLSPAARTLVDGAEVLVGGERHLAMIPKDDRERRAWSSPLTALVEEIANRRGQRVCVLATGDPMAYGIGVTLARRIPRKEMIIIPAPSAFSLAAARMRWSLAEVETFTLHGRPLELLHPFVQPGAKLLLFSDDGTTPARVAALLCARGYGESRMNVLGHMGGPRETDTAALACDWGDRASPDFNTIAITCAAAAEAPLLPRAAGLPDDVFQNDGQLTKREVRCVTLAALAPVAGQHLWDVGAGCGSVAIEWLRAARNTTAVAVERNAARIALIAANAGALGTPQLEIIEGEAPAVLTGLPRPDAVFIGGGLRQDGLLDLCWERLRPGGRLVTNAVTVQGEAALAAWHGRNGGTLTRIAIARAAPVGNLTGWKPFMPVTQLAARKS
jgi:precorrin-6B C5,15-methyltransferase / cobalt-precorrin-6B C5,C15-methyltransferase